MENPGEENRQSEPQAKARPFDQKNVRIAVIAVLLIVVLCLLYIL